MIMSEPAGWPMAPHCWLEKLMENNTHESARTRAPPFGFRGFQLVASKGWVEIGYQIEPLLPSLL
jgi:hypothetical protein